MDFTEILKYFPITLKTDIINKLDNGEFMEKIEEIRLRTNLPIIIKSLNTEKVLNHIVSVDEINQILQKICENSLYAYQNQIANGYVTIYGGHRVGIVGSGVLKDDEIINLNYISSLNFRISRQVIGCSNSIIEEIINRENNTIYNTLIASAPGLGKTTLLKDIIRNLSDGIDTFQGRTISVIDERGEIAASYKGVAQNNLGIRTDVLDNVPKAIGMKMAIRSMAPKVIVADEIGSKQDSEAIRYAIRCGVKGIFTAHASNIYELRKNPELKLMLDEKIFEKIILIKNRNGNQLEKIVYTDEME